MVFLLSVSSILSFPSGRPVVSFIFFFVFPSLLSFLQKTCFTRQFLSKMRPIQIAFHLFSVCRVFLSFKTVRNTYQLFTRSIQLICSILHHHHIRNYPTVSDLLSKVPKFHHHTKTDSKRSVFMLKLYKINKIGLVVKKNRNLRTHSPHSASHTRAPHTHTHTHTYTHTYTHTHTHTVR
jgi:hypothetical protein